MSAPYPLINGTAMGSDLGYLFIYVNTVTGGFFMPLFVLSFFLIVFIGSMVAQLRFTSRERIEVSFAAACFSTLGLATILETKTGLLDPLYFFILIGLTILSIIWLAMSSE